MYIPGSPHIKRRDQLGKSIDLETMSECRGYINTIIQQWGKITLRDLDVDTVMPYLFNLNKSGSWKNRFLEVLGEIYTESAWHNCRTPKPDFQRFAKNSKKADIFTTEEPERLFQPENFPDETFYIFYLLCLSGGLRLGELRAVRVKQIIFDRKVLIIDGFCKKDGKRTIYNKKGTPDHPRLRSVYLPDFTLEKLTDLVAERSLQPEDYCFTLNGKPIRQELAEDVFYRALQKAGFIPLPAKKEKAVRGKGRQKQNREKLKPHDGRKLVPHSLRYTYVSRMRRELSATELQPMSGHASIEMVNFTIGKLLTWPWPPFQNGARQPQRAFLYSGNVFPSLR
jgi:integrase